MGTRNLICVVQDGEFKVAQYAQFDGHPTRTGEKIRQFLVREYAEDKLKKFTAQIALTVEATEEALSEAYDAMKTLGDRWSRQYPQFSRDTGPDILDWILEEEAPAVNSQLSFGGESLFCEWAYVINLDECTLEIYRGFNKKPVSKDNPFKAFENKSDDYKAVRLKAELEISKLKGRRDLMAKIEKEA